MPEQRWSFLTRVFFRKHPTHKNSDSALIVASDGLWDVFDKDAVCEHVQEGIKHGVRKVNIDTDLRMASTGSIRRFMHQNPSAFDPRKYLKEATKYFSDDYEFIIFSDDLNSLKREVNLQDFINLENDNEIEDLYSLSQCDSVIMSNSSFSWWGSFLGKKKEKIICRNTRYIQSK